MKRKNKVLFVCNYYAPDATIAAVRTTKLVKYMKKFGFVVDFLTVQNDNLSIDETLAEEAVGVEVTYARNTTSFLKTQRSINNSIAPAKEKRLSDMSNRYRINRATGHIEFFPFETAYPWIGSIEYLLNQVKQKDLLYSVKGWLDDAESYDYMITSYGDAFCYYVGEYYHKRHPETKWIFDIRDSIYRYKFTPKYVSVIPKCIERRVWKDADIITGVSNGICSRVPRKYRYKVFKVTNGYDYSDRDDINAEPISRDKLIMTFTGSMYGGLQDLSPLFKAVRELVDDGDISDDKIEFHFAGSESAALVFYAQAKKYRLNSLIVNHKKLSRKETILLQSSSDVLLAPSYDYENNKGGVITGKFYEYMLAKRPIIVIVNGDILRSEIADITRKCNIGIAYEESHCKDDFGKLKAYIKELFNQKTQSGIIEYYPNLDEIRKYNYKYITRKFISIMISKGGDK